MSAIGVHHTATTDESWDAGMMVGRMGDAPGEAKLREMHAWVDPDADAATKTAYKFPHHMCSMDGDIGAANLMACSSGIGSLNGGRGGTTVPEADHPGIWRHLAAHMRDGGKEAPELKAARAYCQRSFILTEVRIGDPGNEGLPSIVGHAAVFDTPTTIQSWFGAHRESIAPGAFRKTLQEADVRALFNHNPDWILGRNKAGTLDLAEDNRGLAVTIRPPDTTYARDLIESMRRGDISQMSFGFEVVKDQWTFSEGNELDDRRLLEVRLWDVSPVTFAAYPQTEAFVRSAIHTLQRYLSAEPGRLAHSGDPRRESPIRRHSLATDGSRPEALPKPETVRTDEPARQPSHSLRVDWGRLDRLEVLIAKETGR